MTKERQERLLLAIVVFSIVILFISIMVTIFQVVKINGKKREISSLEKEIDDLIGLREGLSGEIEIWKTDAKIEEVARELGYKMRGDR
jgi:cell division protein FtsL